MAGICRNCKHLTDVNRDVAPTKGWCPIWENWQNVFAKACQHTEQKEQAFRPKKDWSNRTHQANGNVKVTRFKR